MQIALLRGVLRTWAVLLYDSEYFHYYTPTGCRFSSSPRRFLLLQTLCRIMDLLLRILGTFFSIAWLCMSVIFESIANMSGDNVSINKSLATKVGTWLRTAKEICRVIPFFGCNSHLEPRSQSTTFILSYISMILYKCERRMIFLWLLSSIRRTEFA